MDERIKGMWVDALLSGEYPKIEGLLHTQNGYCAYGVLCELAVKEGVKVVVTDHATLTTYDGMTNYPPDTVQDWAGIPGQGLMNEARVQIYSVNDRSERGSFDEVVRFLKDLPGE